MSRQNYNSKRYIHAVFIAALFTIAKAWRQPKCPSIEEWIKKAQYTYTMEYYLDTKKNEIMSFAATWMQLEVIILRKVGEKERQIPSGMTYMWNLKHSINEPI